MNWNLSTEIKFLYSELTLWMGKKNFMMEIGFKSSWGIIEGRRFIEFRRATFPTSIR